MALYSEPKPDRIRVIVIPDAAAGDDDDGVEMSPEDDLVSLANLAEAWS